VICCRSADRCTGQGEPPRVSFAITTSRRLLCFAVLYLAGCVGPGLASGQIQTTDTRENLVQGTVVNAVTNQPIARALVVSGDHLAMLTDSEGHFEFAVPSVPAESPGGSTGLIQSPQFAGANLWVMARKPGFLDDPNERAQFRGPSAGELRISLLPEALIKGRVTLSTSEPAAGVNVQLFSRQVQEGVPHWMQGGMVVTNSNGEFRFAELQPGVYKLVTHEFMDNDPVTRLSATQSFGFPPVYYPNTTDFAAASAILLAAGQTVQADLSLAGHAYYPVNIPVVSSEANRGMNITVALGNDAGPGYSLGYDPTKQIIVGSLPNGNYKVRALSYMSGGMSGQVNIAVADAAVEGPPMVLTRSSSIKIDVREEFTSTDWNGSASWSDGHRTYSLHGPRSYLQVGVEAANDFERETGGLRPPAGPRDESLFLDLAPGRYWLRVHTPRGYVASATMGGIDLLRQSFVVDSASTAPIEIKMRDDGAQIEGTVTGIGASVPTSLPPAPMSWRPGVWVYCVPLPDSPGEFQQLAVSAEGNIGSQKVAPGTYRVLAFKKQQPNLPYRDAELMRVYEGKGQVVHLSAGQKSTLQLQVIPDSE
jgi:hypothetical protein